MNTSNPHQVPQHFGAEPTAEFRPERAERPAQDAPERSKRSTGMHLRLRPIRAAEQEAKHVYQLERAGESEWTPWIAIAALILFYRPSDCSCSESSKQLRTSWRVRPLRAETHGTDMRGWTI
jgi:hypothetical protein